MQLFSYLEREASQNPEYIRYEEERAKWAKWPSPTIGSFVRWKLPDDLNEAKSLSYDLYKSSGEQKDEGLGLSYHLFHNTNPNVNIDKFNETFLSYFTEVLSEILEVENKLSSEDIKDSIERVQVEKEIAPLIKYKTDDPFRKGHIDEINRAYTYECYTCVFILCRKVIENMIIDILRKKFPPKKKENKKLYFDIDKGRFKDFSIILDNFYKKRNEFDLDNKKIVKRIVDLAKSFKKEADDKTHSWFHLVRKRREIDDIDIQGIIDLIKRLEEKLNI